MAGFGAHDDLVHNFDLERAIDPASYTATKTGEEIALSGGPVLVLVTVGAVAAADAENYVTFTVEQATATGGDFSAADSSQYKVADSWDRLINATTEGNAVYAFQFIPAATYDYIKVVGTETGTTEAIYDVTVIQGGRTYPQTT